MKLQELNLNEDNVAYQKWVTAVKKISPKYQIIGSLKRAKAICWDKKDSPIIGTWDGTKGEVFPLEEASEHWKAKRNKMKLSQLHETAMTMKMQDIVKHLEDELGDFEDVTDTEVKNHYVSHHEHSADLTLTLKGDKLLLQLKNDSTDDPEYSDWRMEFDLNGLTPELAANKVEDEIDHYFHHLPDEDDDNEDED